MADFNLSQIDIEHSLNNSIEIHRNRMDNFNKIRTASKRGHEYGARCMLKHQSEFLPLQVNDTISILVNLRDRVAKLGLLGIYNSGKKILGDITKLKQSMEI